MHDETFERRLRGALRDEADGQPFTITAAELERRVSLRGRTAGNRRLTLLLAAAVAIGALNVGALVGEMADLSDPSPDPSAVAVSSDPPATASPAASFVPLPDLDDLFAERGPGEVVFAQSHGPAEGPDVPSGVVSWAFGPPFVGLDPLGSVGPHEVTLACRGGTAVLLVGRDGSVPDIPCDGRVHRRTFELEASRNVGFSFSEPASWRMVVRSAFSTGPTTPPDPAILTAEADQEVLLQLEDETTASGVLTPTVPGMLGMSQNVGAIPPRLSYVAHASCVGESSIRFAFGDEAGGTVVPTTVTQLPCDGRAHSIRLGIPEPFGRQVYVGADPVTRWSLLITSETPPVSVSSDVPGWTPVAEIGPHLEFGTTILSVSGLSVDGGGQVMVVFDCVGQGTVEVTLDVRAATGSGTFVATCTPEGTITSQTFEASYEAVHVEYESTAGHWTALSVLVPDEAIQP